MGLFEVLKPVEKNAYRLWLPSCWRIYNVFHVTLLAKYRTKKGGVSNDFAEWIRFEDNVREKFQDVESIWDFAVYLMKSEDGKLSELFKFFHNKDFSDSEDT